MAEIICEGEIEESIAVGSTGTLLSLIGKEMEILQARKSSSLPGSCRSSLPDNTYYGSKQPRSCQSALNCREIYSAVSCNYRSANVCPGSASSHNHELQAAASPGFNVNAPPHLPSSTSNYSPSTSTAAASSAVSSLWSDLKGLLRSPNSQLHKYHKSPLLKAAGRVINGPDDQYLYLRDPPLLMICSDEDDGGDDDPDAQVQLAFFDRPSCTTSPRARKHPPCNSAAAAACSKERYPAALKDMGANYFATATDHATAPFTGKPCAKAARPEKSRKSISSRSSWNASGGQEERELSALCAIKSYHKESAADQRATRLMQVHECSNYQCEYDDDESLITFTYVDHHHQNRHAAAMQGPLMLRLQPPAEEPFTPASTPHKSCPHRRSNLASVSTVVDLQCCHTSPTSLRSLCTPTTRRLSFTRLISHS
ncbi:hypothetical protein GOP47_0011743 [Adiantum capillus-veneris]|uniref:Uncharacterized protein n=1 Tax=Adiantum capillus-veneris TaxID=13818 RepID=A0A9D4UTW1_ADICA|nr:hypothetical protein GOP47_0011743 [Adiantum capillus-veneris]